MSDLVLTHERGALRESGRRGGMGGHYATEGEKDEWLTPPDLIQALGPFDLDPCASVVRPWPTATTHYTIEDDGLSKVWRGFVWCNPPYGRCTGLWLARMAAHGNGIALIFARTDTKMFFDHVWNRQTCYVQVMFLTGRLSFHRTDGLRALRNAGAPSCLVAYGEKAIRRIHSFRGKNPKGGIIVQRTDGLAVL